MEQQPWGPATVKSIAKEVRRRRQALKMSTQQLADACAAQGFPIKRTVLSNLESGYRETITVPELIVLAKALEVAPIQLVYPIDAEPEVEVLPGHSVPTERAMLWFTGWLDLFKEESDHAVGHGQLDPSSGLHEWYETRYADATAVIGMYAEHRALIAEYEDAPLAAIRRVGSTDAPGYRDEVASLRKQIEERIKAKRAEIRRRGIAALPPLPPELERLS